MYMYKKILISLLTLALAFPVAANPVDRQAAAKAAADLLHKQVVDATPADFTECYLFVGADGHGFALLAADDCVPLLLGYSHTSTFPAGNFPIISTPGSRPTNSISRLPAKLVFRH